MRSRSRVLAALMREHGDELYARAFALTGHLGSADQLLEDALVTALRPWRAPTLGQARRATMTAMHRALARARPRPEEHDAGPALDEIADAPEHAWLADPSAAMHWNVLSARQYIAEHPVRADDAVTAIAVDVAALDAAERVCLVLRYLDGMSAVAIEGETGIPEDEARTLLLRAVDRLSLIHPDLDLDPDDAAWGGQEYVDVEVEP